MVVHVGICAHRISRDLWLKDHHEMEMGRKCCVNRHTEGKVLLVGRLVRSRNSRFGRWKSFHSIKAWWGFAGQVVPSWPSLRNQGVPRGKRETLQPEKWAMLSAMLSAVSEFSFAVGSGGCWCRSVKPRKKTNGPRRVLWLKIWLLKNC